MIAGPLQTPFDEQTRAQIRHQARRMIGKAGYTLPDREDLEQELLLWLWQHQDGFDPSEGEWSTFVAMVLRKKAISLLRRNAAVRRDHRPVRSLHEKEQSPEGIPTEMIHHLEQRDLDRHRGVEHLSDLELLMLKMDLPGLLSEMSGELQMIAGRLQHQCIQEIVEQTGIPRTTLRRRIREIREWLIFRNPDSFEQIAAKF